MRVKRGVKARRRRKRVLKQAKGFRGRSKNTIRQATSRVEKSLTYRFRDRKQKKREFRSLWIARIGAAARANGISYSKLMSGLTIAGVTINRKMLSELGITSPQAFTAICEVARKNSARAAQ